jgi:hypothetical protein
VKLAIVFVISRPVSDVNNMAVCYEVKNTAIIDHKETGSMAAFLISNLIAKNNFNLVG